MSQSENWNQAHLERVERELVLFEKIVWIDQPDSFRYMLNGIITNVILIMAGLGVLFLLNPRTSPIWAEHKHAQHKILSR